MPQKHGLISLMLLQTGFVCTSSLSELLYLFWLNLQFKDTGILLLSCTVEDCPKVSWHLFSLRLHCHCTALPVGGQRLYANQHGEYNFSVPFCQFTLQFCHCRTIIFLRKAMPASVCIFYAIAEYPGKAAVLFQGRGGGTTDGYSLDVWEWHYWCFYPSGSPSLWRFQAVFHFDGDTSIPTGMCHVTIMWLSCYLCAVWNSCSP